MHNTMVTIHEERCMCYVSTVARSSSGGPSCGSSSWKDLACVAHASCFTTLSAPVLVSRTRDTAVWAVKAQCSRSHLPPLLSCTMADSALTLEVADAAAAVTSVSPTHTAL